MCQKSENVNWLTGSANHEHAKYEPILSSVTGLGRASNEANRRMVNAAWKRSFSRIAVTLSSQQITGYSIDGRGSGISVESNALCKMRGLHLV